MWSVSTRFEKRVTSSSKASATVPVGPWRCLPMMHSARPCARSISLIQVACSGVPSRGSLFFTRPTMGHYTATRPDLELSAGRVISAIKSGKLKIRINQTYPLREAAQAHRDLQERKTTGSILLLP